MKLYSRSIYISLLISAVLAAFMVVYMYFFSQMTSMLSLLWIVLFFVTGFFFIRWAIGYFVKSQIAIINDRLKKLTEGDFSFTEKLYNDPSDKYLKDVNKGLMLFAVQKQ